MAGKKGEKALGPKDVEVESEKQGPLSREKRSLSVPDLSALDMATLRSTFEDNTSLSVTLDDIKGSGRQGHGAGQPTDGENGGMSELLTNMRDSPRLQTPDPRPRVQQEVGWSEPEQPRPPRSRK